MTIIGRVSAFLNFIIFYKNNKMIQSEITPSILIQSGRFYIHSMRLNETRRMNIKSARSDHFWWSYRIFKDITL